MQPFEYPFINTANAAVNPSTMHARNVGLSRFYARYLLQKAVSRIDFNIPEEWPKNYFSYVLFIAGHIAVIKTSKYGAIPQYCTLAGYNIYHQPTRALIANPALKQSYDLKIGKETEIIKLSPDYGGIWDLVSYYADLMALASESMGVNILNSKLAYVFAAQNKGIAESFKKLFDNVASGEPATVFDKALLDDDGRPVWQYFAQNLQQNFIAPEILQTMRQIESEFDTVIGIPNANTDKRERLITDEVNANNTETFSRLGLWVDTINDDMQRVNRMFDLDLSAKMKGGAEDAQSDVVPDGDL